MSNHKPSKYQENIYDAWKNTIYNIVVGAVAGSGKTSTAIGIIKRSNPLIEKLYLAFNSSIQKEMDGKLNGISNTKALTLHSLGIRSLYKVFNNFEVYDNKIWKIASKVNKSGGEFWGLSHLEFKKAIIKIRNFVDLWRMTLCENAEDLLLLLDDMGETYTFDDLWRTSDIIDAYKEHNKNPKWIDFTDMIYIPLTNPDIQLASRAKMVFIDEAQDLNKMQQAFVDKLVKQNNARWAAFGDEHQCQPNNTKVLMRDLSEKNIQDIQVGDEVITYAPRSCYFRGYGKANNSKCKKVLKKQTLHRFSKTNLVELESGHSSTYTYNHKCYVSLSKEGMRGKYVTYLMKRGGYYRVGISPCWSESDKFSFATTMRARSEKADSFWILEVFENRKNALIGEQIVSYNYNIPQLRFIDRTSSDRGFSQKDLDHIWSSIPDMNQNAELLLSDHGRDVKYPIWTNQKNNQGGVGNCWKLSVKSMFKTQACNLIPEIMSMSVFDETNRDAKNRVVKKMFKIKSNTLDSSVQDFTSLDIEDDHNYVSDGILTSNSIYGFAGADSDSFKNFLNKPNTISLPLSICYRCPDTVVKEANNVYPIMEKNTFKGKGKVEYDGSLDDVKEGDMMVCRNTRPLIEIFFELLGRDIPAKIKGSDLGKGLIKLIEPFKHMSSHIMIKELDRVGGEIIRKLEEIEISKPESHPSYVDFLEKKEICIFVSTKYDRTSEIIDLFKRIFSDKKFKGVTLCTIHKAKGLENPRVFFVNQHLIPSKYATTPRQIKQENNLRYVAITRAEEELIYINVGTMG